MEIAAKLLEEAMRLPEDEREELAAKLLDSLEPSTGSRSTTRTRSRSALRKPAAVRPEFLG